MNGYYILNMFRLFLDEPKSRLPPKDERMTQTEERTRLRPLDWITVGYFVWLSLAILFGRNRPTGWLIYLIAHGVLCILILLAGRRRNRLPRTLRIIYDWYPYWGAGLLYAELRPMIQLLVPHWFDEFFLSIDVRAWGGFPCAFFERFYSRPLNEIVIFGYFSYYFLPFIIGVPLYRKAEKQPFHQTTAAIFISFLICLVLFLLFPTQGPRQYYHYLRQNPLDGYIIVWIEHHLVGAGGLLGAAFPSSHCAVALVALIQAYRHNKMAFCIFLLLVPLLSFATVYGWYHYVIDVTAGWAVALLGVWIAGRLYRTDTQVGSRGIELGVLADKES